MKSVMRFAPLAIAAAVALAACGKKEEAPAPKAEAKKAAAAPAETTIKIGHVAPARPARIAHLGKDNENGARLAVDEANAAGGVKAGDKTFKLELLAEDDKADPKEGTLVAQKIVDGGAVAVVGHLNSGTSIPASKIYSDASVAQISPSATNPKLTRAGLQDHLPRRRQRQPAGRCAGQLRCRRAEGQDDRHRRRPHRLRPRPGRRVREGRQGKGREGRGA